MTNSITKLQTKLATITTAGEAREAAIDWQRAVANKSQSWGEVADAGALFEQLAKRFDLEEEFKENGII